MKSDHRYTISIVPELDEMVEGYLEDVKVFGVKTNGARQAFITSLIIDEMKFHKLKNKLIKTKKINDK